MAKYVATETDFMIKWNTAYSIVRLNHSIRKILPSTRFYIERKEDSVCKRFSYNLCREDSANHHTVLSTITETDIQDEIHKLIISVGHLIGEWQ